MHMQLLIMINLSHVNRTLGADLHSCHYLKDGRGACQVISNTQQILHC